MFDALAFLAMKTPHTHPSKDDNNHGGCTHSSVWFDFRITSDILVTARVGHRRFIIRFCRMVEFCGRTIILLVQLVDVGLKDDKAGICAGAKDFCFGSKLTHADFQFAFKLGHFDVCFGRKLANADLNFAIEHSSARN